MEILQTINQFARTHEFLTVILLVGTIIGLISLLGKFAMWMQGRENNQLKGK